MIKIFWYWYCDEMGKWLRHVSYSWHYRIYGFRPNGKGDILYHMGLYALITGDVDVIKACINLVNERKRWPDSMNSPFDSKSRLVHRWERIKSWLNKKLRPNHLAYIKYRPQCSMTRDPITMLLCAVYWWQYEMIRDIKIPWYLYRPSFNNWVKYLKTHEYKYKKRYEFWQLLEIRTKVTYPAYVKTLNGFRAWMVDSDSVKAEILKHVEPWNLLHGLLCGDFVSESDIELYQSTEGFLWNSDELPVNPTVLTEHEPFKLDEEILRFLYDNKE